MHVVNRMIMIFLAVVLVAIGAWAIAEAAAHLAGQGAVVLDPGTVAATLKDATWAETGTRTVAWGLVVVGLLLVVAQVKPRRPVDYPARAASPNRHLSYERHGLERLAGQVTESHPDVAAVDRVVLHRRRLVVQARGYVDTPVDATRRDVDESLAQSLASLDLLRPPRVRVVVVPGDRRTR